MTSSNPNPSSEPNPSEPATAELRVQVERYVEQLQAFRIHAAVFAASMVVIILVNLFINLAAGIAGEWSAWWSGWALLGWGLGLAIHGLVVRLARPTGTTSTPTWADRKVDAILADTVD